MEMLKENTYIWKNPSVSLSVVGWPEETTTEPENKSVEIIQVKTLRDRKE